MAELSIFVDETGDYGSNSKYYPDRLDMMGRLSREISLFLKDNTGYLLSFDKIISYYDNGQSEITKMINTLYNAFFFEVEFRRIRPSDFRLSQTADLLCTIELLADKASDNGLTRSDLIFFESRRRLLKDYVKTIRTKRIN